MTEPMPLIIDVSMPTRDAILAAKERAVQSAGITSGTSKVLMLFIASLLEKHLSGLVEINTWPECAAFVHEFFPDLLWT